MTTEHAVESASSVEETQPEIQETQSENTEAQAEAPPEAAPETPEQRAEKLAKALDRKNRAIGKRTAELHAERNQRLALEKRIQELEAPKVKTTLKAEDFETVDEYFEAKAKAIAEEKINEFKSSSDREKDEQKEAEYKTQRSQGFTEKTEKVRETLPDFDKVIEESADEYISEHVQEAILEADNGPLVAYYIAQENLFDSLNRMSPAKAAIEVARIEAKAQALLQKPVSKTPAPLPSNKGTAAGGRSLESMSARDLSKWVRS
jgi:hypothetical protein